MVRWIKDTWSWLVEKTKAALAWVRENRPRLEEEARKVARCGYEALMGLHRRAYAAFNRGRAIAILTVACRQGGNLAYRLAFDQAKAEVQAMSEAEVAHFVVDFFSQTDRGQVGVAVA